MEGPSPRAVSPAPRAVPRWVSRSFGYVPKVLGIVLAAIAVVTTLVLELSLGSAEDDKALDARGVRIDARPVGHRLHSSSQQGAVKRHEIELLFQDRSGKEQRARVLQTHADQLAAAEAGRPLGIEYDPEQPSRARWPGQRLNPLGVDVWPLGLGLGLVGVALVALGFFSAASRRRLYRTGTPRLGRIDGVEARIVNRRAVYELDFSYDGGAFRNSGHLVVRGLLSAPTVGDAWLIVDPKRGHRALPALDD